MIASHWGNGFLTSNSRYLRPSGPGNRVASNTFDPAASAIELPATLSIQRPRQSSRQQHFRPSGLGNRVASSLLIQRPRHATCQRHFRSSGPGMRHASNTYDPAAPSCDMPAVLLIQRPRHATCQRHFRSSGPGNRVASSLSTQRTGNQSCRRIKKQRSLTLTSNSP